MRKESQVILSELSLLAAMIAVANLAIAGTTSEGGCSNGRCQAQRSPYEFTETASGRCRGLSHDLSATVNGQSVDVRACRVSAFPYNTPWPGHQRPVDQSELASYLLVEGNGPMMFAITRKMPFSTCVVRPKSRNVKVDISGQTAMFTVNSPGYFSVEFDGEHHALHLFVEPKRDFIAEYGQPTRTFGPGVHFAGRIEPKDGDRIYLHRDAIVYGSIAIEDAEDVKVFGYGVIDGGIHERIFSSGYARYQNNTYHAFDSKNLVLDGPTLLDSACWACALFNCEDVEIRNVKICGQWRYNTDGIDLVNCRRVAVRNAFVRSFDDALVVKGIPDYFTKPIEDILFEGCTVWCGWANSLLIGPETTAPSINHVTFRDCDVIRAAGSTLAVEGGGEAVIDNVKFEDIRVERGRIARMIFDQCDGRTWTECAGTNLFSDPNLIYMNTRRFNWHDPVRTKPLPKGERPYGRIKKVLFKDISVKLEDGVKEPAVFLSAEELSKTPFGEVRIENLTIDGHPVENVQDLNLREGNEGGKKNLKVIGLVTNDTGCAVCLPVRIGNLRKNVRIDAPDIIHVTGERMTAMKTKDVAVYPWSRQVDDPDPLHWGWVAGSRPKRYRAYECTVRYSLLPETLAVRKEDGSRLELGRDYEVEPTWGAIARLPNGRIGLNETVLLDYACKMRRLDLVYLDPTGEICVRRGESAPVMPVVPALKDGERKVATVWIDPMDGMPSEKNVFYVTEDHYPEMSYAEGEWPAEKLLPKTLAKLREGGVLRILAWGDSVTAGGYLPEEERWQHQFVERLRKAYPKAKILLKTCGWGGKTSETFMSTNTAPANVGHPYNYRERILGSDADLVVMEFVNDDGMSHEAVFERYGKILADFAAEGKEWCILTPHYTRGDWMGLKSQQGVDDDPRGYVKAVREFCAEKGVALADAAARWGRLYRQGIPYESLLVNAINHPNRQGMSYFADALMALFPEN